jgi:hypothetical protein
MTRADDAFDHGRPDLVFDGRSPDIAGMRQAIATSGCFVIRNLFDPEGIACVRARAELVSQAWDFMVARGYTKGLEGFLEGAFKAGHLPSEDIDAAQTTADIIADSHYDEITTELFGTTSRDYALRRSMLNGAANPLGYHQDGFFTEPGYNFWTPLNDAGITAPGLEVAIGSGAPILSHDVVRHDVYNYVVKRYGVQSLWHPEIRAGDVLAFTTFMMHRTYYLPTMNAIRYSLEHRGRIAKRLEIAGVSEKHWSMPQVQSLEDLQLVAGS